MTAAHVPEAIAGYRIVRRLGAGDLGAVYLARNPVLPREDALKVLAPQLSAVGDFAAEFLQSVDTGSVLSHPNIVPIYARGEFAQQLWVAMQFVDGGNLDEVLAQGAMSPRRAVRVVAEAAKALDYAHGQRVIHGAVHPANVLLTASGSGAERVLLSDFGSGRVLDAAGRPRANRSAAPYSAPEVLKGAPYDRLTDVYSLGCVLFRMWTGEVPDPARPVADATAGLPSPAVAVLAKAMARDPAVRYESAGELAAAAAAAVPPEPVERQPLFRSPAPPPAGRRRRRGAIVAALLAAIVLTVAAVVGTQLSGSSSGGGTDPDALPSPAPQRTVAVSELKGLLLDAAQLRAIFGVTMSMAQDEARLGREPQDNAACAGAFVPGEVREYTTTGYLGVQFQRWEERAAEGGVGGILPNVSQAVVAFPSAAVAKLFDERERDRWAACVNRQIVIGSTRVVFSDLGYSDRGVLTLKQTSEGGMGLGCGRALTIRGNVAVDVVACFTEDDEAKAVAVLDQIADGIES